MVRLKTPDGTFFYDWKTVNHPNRAGFYLRDPDSLRLFDGSLIAQKTVIIFGSDDVGLIIKIGLPSMSSNDVTSTTPRGRFDRNKWLADCVIILNSRNQTGAIHKDVLKVIG